MELLFLDTEFNGFGGELISMALVSKTHEWYKTQTIKTKCIPWVEQNVIPNLGILPSTPVALKTTFHAFITQFENPQVICDWYEDALHFLELFKGHTPGMALKHPCALHLVNPPPNSLNSKIPHNALSDAKALMEWFYKTRNN